MIKRTHRTAPKLERAPVPGNCGQVIANDSQVSRDVIDAGNSLVYSSLDGKNETKSPFGE